MSHVLQDLRYALRSLRTRPGFSLVVVLTLGLGIGVNTAIVSLVNAVLLKPLPFADPDRLLMVWGSCPELAAQVGLPDKLPPSPAASSDWRAQAHGVEKLAMLRADRVNLTGQGEPAVLGVVAVTGDFFSALGTPPLLGRTIAPADDDAGTGKVAVLSNGFWRRRFGGETSVVGRAIQLDGKPVTVVGVMPPRFGFPRGAEMPNGYGFAAEPDLWLPMAWSAEERHQRGNHGAIPIGRLKPGVSLAAADAEMKSIAQRLAELYPDTDKGWSVRLEPLGAQIVGEVRPALLILLGAVGFVLLIACANVANLLLAQAAVRQREIAIRTSLGADRGRLLRQLLTESLVLALLGGGFGVLLALWGLQAFSAWLPVGLPGAAALALDGRVLAVTAGLALLTGLAAGLAPALQTTRPDLAESLREGTRSGGAALGRRTRSLLVAAEMAVAVLLLVGAGLLIRSFVRLSSVDPGFRAENALTFHLSMPRTRIKSEERAAFVDRVIERLRALPGVGAVGAVSTLPLAGEENMDNFVYEGEAPPQRGQLVLADDRATTGGYFAALGIPLRRGRTFTASEDAKAPR
ncbi:MAG TPA: ADOP family duplicated permease, partial [Thermoanaerobaculia bacterium]